MYTSMTRIKIAICSKARANEQKTLKLLYKFFRKEDIYLFIEPQDIKEYEKYKSVASIVDIKRNGAGIGYARNFSLNYFKQDHAVWMIDDDVSGFSYRNFNGKLKKVRDIKVMAYDLAKEMRTKGLAVIGTKFASIAFYNSDSIGQIAGTYLIDKSKIGLINYRNNLYYNEEKMFLIDLLAGNKSVGVSERYFHIVEGTGTKGGGCQKFSEAIKQKSLKKIISNYPDYCKWFHNKLGEKRLRFKWKKIQESQS